LHTLRSSKQPQSAGRPLMAAEELSASAPLTFLSRLSSAETAELIALGVKRKYPSDSVLMFQDEPDERLLLLLQGRVKVTRSAAGEHELLLAIRDPGELLGELAFIDGLPRLATVSALEDVQALVLGGRDFRAHLESRPHVAVVLLESVAARFREATIRRLQFAAADTLGRLAARVIELADRYGAPDDAGIVIAMPISQDELASWTGASRAGVAHGLQVMRGLGWLTSERGRLIVHDLDAVRARAA
jgi:CRP/FNR family cyclic AMP-dependent transcriptional regulator